MGGGEVSGGDDDCCSCFGGGKMPFHYRVTKMECNASEWYRELPGGLSEQFKVVFCVLLFPCRSPCHRR